MTKNNKKLIAYCGLYCGDCFGYKQKIQDLARDLRKELRMSKYEQFAKFISKYPFAKKLENYRVCYETMGEMVKFRCHKGCRAGGGSPFCNIRKCCVKKRLEGCWLCDEFEKCKKLKFLEAVHGDAHIKNLRIIKKQGTEKFIKGKRHW